MRRQRLRKQAAPRPGPETYSFFVPAPGAKSRLRRPIRLMGTWCRQVANDPNVADTRLARFPASGQIAVGAGRSSFAIAKVTSSADAATTDGRGRRNAGMARSDRDGGDLSARTGRDGAGVPLGRQALQRRGALRLVRLAPLRLAPRAGPLS